MSNETVSTLERILIATDGSPQAQWATQYGAQLAEQLGAQVLLMHVAVPSIPTSGDFVTAQRVEEVRRNNGADLLARTRRLFPPDVEVLTAQRVGLPCEEIAAEARRWNADLVIVGTHGQGRIRRLVLGSTADAVIRQADCPVITVSHQPRYQAPHPTEWVDKLPDGAEPVAAHINHASADE